MEKASNGIKHQVANTIKEGVDKSSEIASSVGESIQEFAGSAKKAGTAIANEVTNVAADAYSQVKDTTCKAYEQVTDTSRKGIQLLEEEIHRYPLTAIIAAFGVGALLGKMFTRRA